MLESRGAILSLIGRGIEIVWNLGFYWSTLMYDLLVGRDEEVVPFRARQLRNLLCDLGPSFIKAGQVCPHYAFYVLWKSSYVVAIYYIPFLFMLLSADPSVFLAICKLTLVFQELDWTGMWVYENHYSSGLLSLQKS